MSITSVGVRSAGSRSLVAPRKVSRASSSPVSTCGSNPKRSPTVWANSSPLAASRTALVITATARLRRRGASITLPVVVEHREHALHRVVAQPTAGVDAGAQARVTGLALSSSLTRPSSTSAMNSRVEFVPMSTTATHGTSAGRVDLVGHRLAVEPGEQVVDGELGHPLARGPGGRADVRRPRSGSARRAAGRRAASGSGSVTSSAAPAISRRVSASGSAAWSTIGPRAVLTRIARAASSAPAPRRRSGGGSPGSAGSAARRSPSARAACSSARRRSPRAGMQHLHLEARAPGGRPRGRSARGR